MNLDFELKEIVKIYENLLSNSKGYDDIRLVGLAILKSYIREKYDSNVEEYAIIDSITSLLSLIRKRIEEIPDDFREKRKQTYQGLIRSHNTLSAKIEGKDGIFSRINKKQPISEEIKKLRTIVYTIVKTLSIFVPEEILFIEKLTDITLKLRELGITKSAELLESLALEKMDNITKITKVRSSLEQTLIAVLKSNEINSVKKFFHNLDALAQNSLINKSLQKSFSKHYSFVSGIIHSEIEASNENVTYGLNIILQIILKILPIFKQKK